MRQMSVNWVLNTALLHLNDLDIFQIIMTVPFNVLCNHSLHAGRLKLS
jgi:transglutaminase/protease-like cytokinesis protein 3